MFECCGREKKIPSLLLPEIEPWLVIQPIDSSLYCLIYHGSEAVAFKGKYSFRSKIVLNKF
jgi:hypothetical protein